jgi:hypothetical protein
MSMTEPLTDSPPGLDKPTDAAGMPLGRFVAVLTPVFAVGAAWIAALAARHIPGVVLDQAEITSLMLAVATTAAASALKWLHGWQKHEAREAERALTPNGSRR